MTSAQSDPEVPTTFTRAAAYERFMGRWSRRVATELVAFSGVCDGDTVLDVGSGTGALSLAVRDATTSSRVTGIDASADYVAHANQHGADRIAFEVGDAQQLSFAGDAFDRTLSLLVLNFVPDPARAVNEWIRVTKPGGTVSAAVWDYGQGMEMLRAFWDEAIALAPAIEARDEAHMPLCRRGELAALWTSVGLETVEEVPIVVGLHFDSFDDYWAPFLLGQGPAGAHAASLPHDRQAALRERLRERLLGVRADGPIDMRARAWAVKGRRSPRPPTADDRGQGARRLSGPR